MSSRLWDILVGEPQHAYDAFAAYRDSTKPRPSPDHLAAVFGMTMGDALYYARVYQWVQRAASYDKYFEEMHEEHKIAASISVAEEVMQEHRLILNAGRSALLTEILKFVKTSKASPRQVLEPKDLLRFMDILFKHDRLALGKATEIVETAIDYANMSDEDLARALEIQDRNKFK